MTQALSKEYVWLDGAIHATDVVAIGPMTHALHYGSAVFKGIRAYETPKGSATFRLQDRIERFFRSSDVYGPNVQFSHDDAVMAYPFGEARVRFLSGAIRRLDGSRCMG